MIHPHTEVRFIKTEMGHGLFATKNFPAGTITWVRDELDREIPPAELAQYPEPIREIISHFSYRNSMGHYIFCWDNTRYMNHNNNFNTCITAYDFEIAIRDIAKDDEVTNHYGMLNIIESFELPDGVIVLPDDLRRHSHQWDKLLKNVFPLVNRVKQPLTEVDPILQPPLYSF